MIAHAPHRPSLAHALVVSAIVTLAASCLDVAIPGDLVITCADDDECDTGSRCAVVLGRCVKEADFGNICGDGVVGVGEQCDDGLQNADVRDTCRTDCNLPAQSDGIADSGELCDDGNAIDGDGCDSNNTFSGCGNGIVAGTEECDDGNGSDDDGCDSNCTLSGCGNGVVAGSEVCDDGNIVDGDGCDSNCRITGCGNGQVTGDEACDDGNATDGDGCDANCQPTGCGNGRVVGNEVCDDGNTVDGDGCDANCQPTGCGNGQVTANEACDDGNVTDDDGCDANCQPTGCGNGRVTGDEECDDGNDASGDGCDDDCTISRCGNGIAAGLEQCDDGNDNNDDGCTNACRFPICGDGVTQTIEDCDDANANPFDGCDACRAQRWVPDVLVEGRLEGKRGLEVAMQEPRAVAWDRVGRLYVADALDRVVRRLDPDGSIRTIATDVRASGLAVDGAGRVFLAEGSDARVRRVDPDGSIVLVAGTGSFAFGGDGGPATGASFRSPVSVAVDGLGRIYVVDSGNNRVRRIEVNGTIATVAGSGEAGCAFSPGGCTGTFSGDGELATAATLSAPGDIVVDSRGGFYVHDLGHRRIRYVDPDGVIRTVAGNGDAPDFTADGQPALGTPLGTPSGLAVDVAGRLVFGDTGNFTLGFTSHRVRRIEADGTLSTIAGTGLVGFSGDGGLATAAQLSSVLDIAVDGDGRVAIVDAGNRRLRVVDATGVIATVAGTGEPPRENGVGVSTPLTPGGLAVDALGRILLADGPHRLVRRLDPDGSIHILAGNGGFGVALDGAVARGTALQEPRGVAAGADGDVYLCEDVGAKVWRIDPQGVLHRVAGAIDGRGFGGDGGPAVDALLRRPFDLAFDREGRLYVADAENNRVRRIDVDGVITTVAGTGTAGAAGDGGPSTAAQLSFPTGVFVDDDDRLWIADLGNHRVRRVESNGTITTVAGDGTAGFSGDGLPATLAQLRSPRDVALDELGRLVIVDGSNERIRRVEIDGTMQTVAGRDLSGFGGDGGPAVDATFTGLGSIVVDGAGRIVVSDGVNGRLRRIDVDDAETITTIAGLVDPPGPGPFAAAQLYPMRAFAQLDVDRFLGVGDRVGFDTFGNPTTRGVLVNLTAERVSVVIGYDRASPAVTGRAAFAPLLADARGIAFDREHGRLVITEHGSEVRADRNGTLVIIPIDNGSLRFIDVDVDDDGTIDDPARWTHTQRFTQLQDAAGIAYDPTTDTFVVAEQERHCVVRIDGTGAIIGAPVFGECGTRGSFPGLLDNPTHVLVSPMSGAVYVADTGNMRVLRVDDAGADIVIGDGSVSSAGEGAPARLFPIDEPRQMVLDEFGDLYVTSTTTVREVANTDGDLDADGDDTVITIYGGGARAAFPESDSLCLGALSRGDDGTLYVADSCQGFLVRLAAVTGP